MDYIYIYYICDILWIVKMGEFFNGLFGCFNNCILCFIIYIVLCYIVGKNVEVVGDLCIMVGVLYVIFFIVGIYFVVKICEKIWE